MLCDYSQPVLSGLCGNNNNDTTDDFTTSSGITENSPQPFALSWSVGTCAVNIPPTCSNRDNGTNEWQRSTCRGVIIFKLQVVLQIHTIILICIFAEIFADEKCSVLNNPTGIFAECHSHITADQYHTVRLLQSNQNLDEQLTDNGIPMMDFANVK